ncbi:MAG: hypothetical protein AB7I19_16935 [Planctomycetota bacterium]
MLAASFLLTERGSAQSGTISPRHFATVEAGTSSSGPLANLQVRNRYQQIHDDLPIRSRLIRGLAFRRDSVRATFTAFSMELELRMSDANRSSAAPSANFDDNLRSNPLLVFARRSLNFPASAFRREMPAPFEYVIPFDQPFSLSSSVCWEMLTFSRSATSNVRFDAVEAPLGDLDPGLSTQQVGGGCEATGRTGPMRAAGAFVHDWPNGTFRATFGSENGPASGAHIATIGFDNLQWLGIPLPFEIPGSNVGPSGRCFVHNDILRAVGGNSNAAGVFTTGQLNLVLDTNLHGITFHHQVVALDASANASGFVTSDSLARQIVAPFPRPSVARIELFGGQGATGNVRIGSGLITRFLD